MTREEKNILLKDLSARLPYGVIIQHPNYDEPQELDTIFNYNAYVDGIIQCACDDIDEIVEHQNSLTACRPYLRPMSSMTEEEFHDIIIIDNKRGIFSSRHLTLHLDGEVIDYLNSKMFDWRNLISKGLAIEAPEGMYNYNQQ